MNYLILQNPGHNRVYYLSSEKMALAELQVACSKISTKVTFFEIKELAGIRYLSFETDAELTNNDLELISRLSFVFALFALHSVDDVDYLKPLAKVPYEFWDGKINTVLKYQGKTNELFTKMMINVGMLSSDFFYNDTINLLDPVAGKGTTLFEASIYGFNAFGIEIEPHPVHDAGIFFKKYLEDERIKHLANKRVVYSAGKNDVTQIHEFIFAQSKEAFKDPEKTKTLGLINGDGLEAFKYFKKEKFHLVVGDLPYGISHGNQAGRKSQSKTRNPYELVKSGIPAWKKVLKKGGCIVLSWNSYVITRQKLSRLFEENGMVVLNDHPYNDFQHQVDKSIKRDMVVVRKE